MSAKRFLLKRNPDTANDGKAGDIKPPAKKIILNREMALAGPPAISEPHPLKLGFKRKLITAPPAKKVISYRSSPEAVNKVEKKTNNTALKYKLAAEKVEKKTTNTTPKTGARITAPHVETKQFRDTRFDFLKITKTKDPEIEKIVLETTERFHKQIERLCPAPQDMEGLSKEEKMEKRKIVFDLI